MKIEYEITCTNNEVLGYFKNRKFHLFRDRHDRYSVKNNAIIYKHEFPFVPIHHAVVDYRKKYPNADINKLVFTIRKRDSKNKEFKTFFSDTPYNLIESIALYERLCLLSVQNGIALSNQEIIFLVNHDRVDKIYTDNKRGMIIVRINDELFAVKFEGSLFRVQLPTKVE